MSRDATCRVRLALSSLFNLGRATSPPRLWGIRLPVHIFVPDLTFSSCLLFVYSLRLYYLCADDSARCEANLGRVGSVVGVPADDGVPFAPRPPYGVRRSGELLRMCPPHAPFRPPDHGARLPARLPLVSTLSGALPLCFHYAAGPLRASSRPPLPDGACRCRRACRGHSPFPWSSLRLKNRNLVFRFSNL